MTTDITKKTKVLILVTQSDWGGAQRYTFDLATNLSRTLFDVRVAAGQSISGETTLIKRLLHANIPATRLHHVIRAINPLQDIFAVHEIYSLCKKFGPDVVHLNSAKIGIVGSIAARLAGVKKIVYTVHGFAFHEDIAIWKKWLYRLSEKLTARYKDSVICLSQFEKQSAINEVNFPAEKISIISNGINPTSLVYLEQSIARQQLNVPADTLVIGTIANFYPAKALPDMISAFGLVHRQLPTCKLLILGDGPERLNIETAIEKNNVQSAVLLVGKKQNAAQYLNAFDVFVSSSTKEGFPFSILEAMFAGLPIVATTVGAMPEIIETNVHGVLVAPGKPQQLADALLKMLSHTQSANEMGQRAHKKALQSFTLQSAIERVTTLYRA